MAETMNYFPVNIYLEGYEAFSFGGLKLKKKGRASGGFLILVKNEIASQVKFLHSDTKYCIWIEILLAEGNPIILGYTYIPPEDSEIHKHFDEPLFLFQKINEEIELLKRKGSLLLIGDWNARLGNLKDDLVLDEVSSPCNLVFQERSNIDTIINNFGFQLLQICYNHNLKLLNGRWGPSSDKWTHFHDTTSTYNSGVGSSVVDWALADETIMRKISAFSVGDDWDFSDHAQLKVELNIAVQIQQKSRTTIKPFLIQDVFPYGSGYKIQRSSCTSCLLKMNME
jgi:exonuclease III